MARCRVKLFGMRQTKRFSSAVSVLVTVVPVQRVRSRSRQMGQLLHGLASARLLFHGLTPHGNRYWRPFGTNEVALRAAETFWLRWGTGR
jgi:hypothetical protein